VEEILYSDLQEKISNAHCVGNFSFKEKFISFQNIGEMVAQHAREFAQLPFCIFYSDSANEKTRTEISYEEFYLRVGETTNFLLQHKILRGDNVAVVSFNHLDTVIQYFAIWFLGAVVVPINIGEDNVRIEYILSNSNAKLAFVREQYLEKLESIVENNSSLKKTIQLIRTGNSLSLPLKNAYVEFPSATFHLQSEISLREIPTLDDEALLVYTSGTTGLPKGVVLTQYNLLVDAKEISAWHYITSEQRMMCVLPLHHVNGIIVTLITPMYVGASVVLNQKFHSRSFFERIQSENVNVVSVVPTLLQFLLHEHSNASFISVPSLRHIICGAGPLTVELALRFEERFHIPILHGYGLSETTCYSCFLPLELSEEEHKHWLKDFGFPSIGVPIPCNEMTIHDEQGNELSEGEKGEIVIRGHNVMKYYFQNDEANAKTFAFSWFRSGDEGKGILSMR